MDVLLAHVTESPPTFTSLGVGDRVPPAIETVVQACLAKEPAERPASARDLAEHYELALAQQHVEPEKPPPEPLHPPPAAGATAAEVPAVLAHDPNTVVHQLEAWMPETVAAYKLRGFVHDVGGEVLESIPGRIRVRLGGPGTVYGARGRTSLSWLGLGRKAGLIDLELHLNRTESNRGNVLHITVLLRPSHKWTADTDWRDRCTQIYCDLRGYLMGNAGTASEAAP
jgi:serine/threonine-protein kinase